MHFKIFLALIVSTLLFGCVSQTQSQNYELNDFINVLESSQDFKDYKADFLKYSGANFSPKIIEATHLTPEIITQRISELNSNPTTAPLSEIYSNLPASNDLYFVKLSDSKLSEKGIIAVLEMKEAKTLKFFAFINLVVNS